MFIVGPSNLKIALSTDESCWNCDENGSNRHSIVIDVSSTIVRYSQNRHLIVGKKRLLLVHILMYLNMLFKDYVKHLEWCLIVAALIRLYSIGVH